MRGQGSGVVFYNEERDTSCVCHGDDFTLVAEESELRWLAWLMGECFEIKARRLLGPENKDMKEIVILGRVVRWTADGVEFEADPRHRKVLKNHFGFEERVKGATINGGKERKEEEEEGDEEDMERGRLRYSGGW